MTKEKFVFTVRNENMLRQLIHGFNLTTDEYSLIAQCSLTKANIMPKEKHLSLYLKSQNLLDKSLLRKLAQYIKNQYNPEGEVTITLIKKSESLSLFYEDEEDYKNNRRIEVSTKEQIKSKRTRSRRSKIIPINDTIKLDIYEPNNINNMNNINDTNDIIDINDTDDMNYIDELNDVNDIVEQEEMIQPDEPGENIIDMPVKMEPEMTFTTEKISKSVETPAELPQQNDDLQKEKVVKIKGKTTDIENINAEGQKVTIEGNLSSLNVDDSEKVLWRETSKGILIKFSVVDSTDGITCIKFYKKAEKKDSLKQAQELRDVSRVRVQGKTHKVKDSLTNEIEIWADKIEPLAEEISMRQDDYPEKRVELHCHTLMSTMDAIMSAGDIVKQAAKWNWSSVAITDHGVVQAYPEAANTAAKLKKQGQNIKVIYGVEGYLVGEDYKQKFANHIIILAKNKIGLKNLYKLVSLSHMRFFYHTPRIPKSILSAHREGLIIGSACEAGELIRSIVAGKTDYELEEIANFYDYLEIQPIHNNDFLKRSNEFPEITTDEDLIAINVKVAELAKKLNKPLVATCDAHFMNREDSIFRAILMRGKGFKDATIQPPLYLRTTQEMLEEFTYLDKDLAYEAVIKNPNMIAEQIEELQPIPKELYSPQVDGAETELKEKSYKRASELYGDELPEIVQKRLEQELKPIIGHGFSALYMIAERLVKKSNADGYIVGSRGSVGSSFVATMLGITEVNPLPPHWHCPKCRYSEFITDGSVNCGYDLDDKNCPNCGTKMKKDGHDIPFAVFLGFDGDKVPDIDLNFSGVYQPTAHKYTEVLFGKYNVYRAGTISTVAAKTAYGLVKAYYEEQGKHKNGAFINYISQRCQGAKKTTGQHPAGIMVVPRDMDVHYFTPLQRPADDKESKTITTHFDYHSISERLVKLDILGHDDPTVIKMLEDLTGIDVNDIPLDDEKTMSLFTSTKALGVSAEKLGNKTGTFGIPEFRTAFTRQMIDATKPKYFSDLVRISGFSHGTDVWLGNAQELIKNGTCTLKDAISARDDIMTYLIYKGVDPLLSFKTMEGVRKGRGIADEVVEELKKHDVPDWYIESCQKIKYLFPKAHATAYVMMAFRIAYFKVHYPLAYYAAYFTSRGEEFDADEVIKGDDFIVKIIKELESKNHLDVKETAKLAVLQVAHEMFLRGFKLKPINIYQSKAEEFIIDEDQKHLIPPFRALHGMGEVAAKSVVTARETGEFLSIEDLKNRAKLSKTNIEVLRGHGCLEGMDESAQQTLF